MVEGHTSAAPNLPQDEREAHQQLADERCELVRNTIVECSKGQISESRLAIQGLPGFVKGSLDEARTVLKFMELSDLRSLAQDLEKGRPPTSRDGGDQATTAETASATSEDSAGDGAGG